MIVICLTLLLGFVSPTPAQKEVIPKLLLGDNVVIASRTGSGKTLAFLLPTFQKLLQQVHYFSN